MKKANLLSPAGELLEVIEIRTCSKFIIYRGRLFMLNNIDKECYYTEQSYLEIY